MNNEIKNIFSEFKVTGERSAISIEDKREKDLALISRLKTFIESNAVTDLEDIGFCYWNISDNYALLNDGNSLFLNHQKFHKFLKDKKHIICIGSFVMQPKD